MGSKTKQTTTVAPPSWAQGYVNNALSGEQSAYNGANSTYQQYRPYEDQALQTISNNIAHPAPFITDAQNQLDKTINGDYLNPASNPYEQNIANLIADKTQGEYNGTFGAAGRAHGGLAALLSGQGVGDALQSFYGNNYNAERGRQMEAIGMEPGMNASQYTGVNELFPSISSTAMGPLQAASMYGASTANSVGPYGTSTTKTSTPFGLQQALGLGLMGASMFIPGAQPLMGMGMAGGGGMTPYVPGGGGSSGLPLYNPSSYGFGTSGYLG